MGHFSIELSTTKADVYSVPGSGILKVQMVGFDTLFYNAETGAWKSGDQAQSAPPALPEQELTRLIKELNSVDQWRKDFYAGRLRSEYPLPAKFGNQEILDTYDEIDKLLTAKVPSERDFKRRLESAIGITPTDRERIRELYELRNTLVAHNRSMGASVSLSDEGRRSIEAVRDKLMGKLTVGKAMIPVEKILRAVWSDRVLPKVKIMMAKAYSHIPILDESGLMDGLFSSEALLQALVEKTIFELDEKTTFADIDKFVRIRNGRTAGEHLEYARQVMSIAKLSGVFSARRDEQIRASIAFITQNGRPTERLLGLITVWDLPGNS